LQFRGRFSSHSVFEFNPIQIDGAVANCPAKFHSVARIGWAEFQGNGSAYAEIGDGEQVQSTVADLDTERVDVS
jgi:hypothetical protein